MFENEKTVVLKEKQLFERKVNELRVSTITKKKIMQLHEQFGDNIIFSRADIMRITGITSSPAGDYAVGIINHINYNDAPLCFSIEVSAL